MSCLANALSVLLAVSTANAGDENGRAEVREPAPAVAKASVAPRPLERDRNGRVVLKKTATVASRL